MKTQQNKRIEQCTIMNINKNTIGNEFWPVLFWLKLLGNCPIEKPGTEGTGTCNLRELWGASSQNEESNERFKFRYSPIFSFAMFLNLIPAIGFTFCNIIFIINAGFQIPFITPGLKAYGKIPRFLFFPNNHTQPGKRLNTGQEQMTKMLAKSLIVFVTQSMQIFEILLAWISMKDYIIFLNNWPKFEKLSYYAFGQLNDAQIGLEYQFLPKIRKLRKQVLVWLVGFPSVVLLPLFPFMSTDDGRFAGTVAVVGFSTLQLITRSLLEDSKTIFSYVVLVEAYSHTRHGIHRVVLADEENNFVVSKISATKIRAWGSLIEFTRSQCDLLGKSQKSFQLATICMSTVSFTILTFVILTCWTLVEDETGIIFIIICVIECVQHVGRLWYKAKWAENITVEEEKIYDEISSINVDLSVSNVPAQLQVVSHITLAVSLIFFFCRGVQIQSILHLLKASPVCIKFGNYVTFNTKLLLGVVSQVLTYLIILMQLHSSM